MTAISDSRVRQLVADTCHRRFQLEDVRASDCYQ